MSVYLLNIYYQNALSQVHRLQQMKDDLDLLCKNEYRVLKKNQHTSTFLFCTDVHHFDLKKHLNLDSGEDFEVLLAKVDTVISGYFSSDIWNWIRNREV